MIRDNVDIERYCVAAVLRFPNLLADVGFVIKEEAFKSKLNRTIYSSCFSSYQKQEEIDGLMLASKIKGAGITFEELDGDILDYITDLKDIQINEAGGKSFFKDLGKLHLLRKYYSLGELVKVKAKEMVGKDMSEILSTMDGVLGSLDPNISGLFNNEFINIYEGLAEKIELLGNSPKQEVGYMGPFKRVNEIYGSLLRPGNITLIAARSGVGKTNLGSYYLNYIGYTYGIPVLHIDAGEMLAEELQFRNASMLTGGKASVYHIEHGSWRQNPELEKTVRESFSKYEKLKYYYRNIGGMSPDEIISMIRRFYYSVVGRGKPFVIHYDYLKPPNDPNNKSPQWERMGVFMQKLKTLITTEIPVPVWTSVQQNRKGIMGYKEDEEVNDTEDTVSISDSITAQASHLWILRRKTKRELISQPKLGNFLFKNVGKKRHLGKDADAALNMVRMSDGSLQENYIHLDCQSFVFKEMGDLATTHDKIGIIKPPKDNNDESVDINR